MPGATSVDIASIGLSAGRTSIFKPDRTKLGSMSLEREHDCPECGGTTFWRTASMKIQLGEKTKWRCEECDYGFIEINGISTLKA
jgi:predicted RNA-binding Zn-ribbon protein involved in translation (DUF1610 family)